MDDNSPTDLNFSFANEIITITGKAKQGSTVTFTSGRYKLGNALVTNEPVIKGLKL